MTSCLPKKIEEDDAKVEEINTDELFYIQFYAVNNRAKIYLDGKLVEDTGFIPDNKDSEQTVSLSDHLTKGKQTLKIELYNGMNNPSDQYDRVWEIYFEVFLKGEPIDYIHEKLDKYANGYGLVWTYEYEINNL